MKRIASHTKPDIYLFKGLAMRFLQKIFFLIALLFLSACGVFPGAQTDIDHFFEEGMYPQERFYQTDKGTVGYAEVNLVDEDAKTIVLLHGSPGRWKHYARYLGDQDIYERARLLAFDRPGWGWSRDVGVTPSVEEQGRLVWQAIEDAHNMDKDKSIILVGHSYGPSVAVAMALKHSDKIAGLILISDALDPALEVPR